MNLLSRLFGVKTSSSTSQSENPNSSLTSQNKSRYFTLKTIMMSCMALVFFIMVSCSDCCALPLEDMGAITNLEQIDGHYKDLASISPVSRAEAKDMDAIRFPNKKNEFIIKLFQPEYLTRSQIQNLMMSLKPPANSSAQTQAELDFLVDLQNSRTTDQVDEALRMHEIIYFPLPGSKTIEDLFFEVFEVMGSDLDPERYPYTEKLLHNLMKDMRIMEFEAKNNFLRARPRQLSSALQPLKKMQSSSFASGHTLWAYLHAYTLAELIPSKRNEFMDLAYRIGFSREVLGVHYPSDEEASRVLAHTMLSEMWNTEKFKGDFSRALVEWNGQE